MAVKAGIRFHFFMHKIYIAFSLLAAVGMSVLVAADAENLSVPHITVVGTSSKDIAPDRLNWAVEIKTIGPELPKVAEQHAKEVAAVLALLKAQSLPDKDVQTSNMQFAENQVLHEREYVKEGYYASTTVAFLLTDLTKYKPLWLSLAGLKNVSVKSVTFDHSNRSALQKDTRSQALLEARTRAISMAETLSAKVGEPLAIEDEAPDMERWAVFGAAPDPILPPLSNGSDANSNSLAPGTIPIKARVRVTFRLIGAGN